MKHFSMIFSLWLLQISTCVQHPSLDQILHKYFLGINVNASIPEIESNIITNKLLRVQKSSSDTILNYQIIKSASFDKHPFIDNLGFKNNLYLQKLTSENGKLKQVSIVLNYRSDKKKAYMKLSKDIQMHFKPFFQKIEIKEDEFSFSKVKTVSFYESEDDLNRTLILSLKETFTEINNAEKSVYSLILTYQSKIKE
jgi:hypothetical protein